MSVQFFFPYTSLPWPTSLGGKEQAQEGSADLLLFPTACGVGNAPAVWSRLGAVWESISWPVHPAAATAVGTTSVMGDVTCFTQGRFSKPSGLGWSLILVPLLS